MKKYIIVDGRISKDSLRSLEALGFSPILLPKSDSLPEPLSSHTDMVLFHHGRTLISTAEYMERHPSLFRKIKEALPHFDIRISEEKLGKSYPFDAILNALVIGDKIFCKTDSVCREILSYAKEVGLRVINVRQGYPACTVLPISDSFAITSDMGMRDAMISEGIRVLTVPECDKILLPPYKNGFIGGSAGKDGEKIYFAGNPKALPYFNIMEEFAVEAGVALITLDAEFCGLTDLGGLAFCE